MIREFIVESTGAEAHRRVLKIIKTRWIDINKVDDEHPNYRSRFVAKEFIDVFAYRSGKAGIALILFVISHTMDLTLDSHYLYGIAGLLCLLWLAIAIENNCVKDNVIPV